MSSALALLILALFSVGWLHPDEHFQILEFARWKLDPSNPAPLPWEFHCRMRPSVQPALVVALSRGMSLAGIRDPFALTMLLRLLSGALSFVALWRIHRWYESQISGPAMKHQFLLLSFLTWFTLYLAVRYSSETWSGALFVIGFTMPFPGNTAGKYRFLIAGLLLGCAFIIRYQAGFMVAGFVLWLFFIRKEKPLHLLILAAGFLAAFAAGILADRWFYGEWVMTVWNYFEQNIVADKISGFGLQPWYFYLTEPGKELIPPFSILILLAFLLVFLFRWKDPLTWTLLPFVLVHFAIGHKEIRFLFPLAWFVPVMLIKGAEIVTSRYGSGWMKARISRILMTVFWFTNFVLLTVLFFIPADKQANLYRYLFRQKGPVTLCYMEENPYERGLLVEFYRNPRLTFAEVHGVESLDTVRGACYLAVKTANPDLSKLKGRRARRVYSSLPGSARYINFNHWLDRTKVWHLFRLE